MIVDEVIHLNSGKRHGNCYIDCHAIFEIFSLLKSINVIIEHHYVIKGIGMKF